MDNVVEDFVPHAFSLRRDTAVRGIAHCRVAYNSRRRVGNLRNAAGKAGSIAYGLNAAQ